MRGARQAPAELHRHAAPLRSPAAFHLVHRGHGDGAATNTASQPHEVKGNASLHELWGSFSGFTREAITAYGA